MLLLSAAKSLFLTSREHTLEVSFQVIQEENSYLIYASAEHAKCFECCDLGHKCFTCPHKDDKWPFTSLGHVNNANQPQKHTEEQRTETQEKAASEAVSDISETVTGEIESEAQGNDGGICEPETKAGVSEGNMI